MIKDTSKGAIKLFTSINTDSMKHVPPERVERSPSLCVKKFRVKRETAFDDPVQMMSNFYFNRDFGQINKIEVSDDELNSRNKLPSITQLEDSRTHRQNPKMF